MSIEGYLNRRPTSTATYLDVDAKEPTLNRKERRAVKSLKIEDLGPDAATKSIDAYRILTNVMAIIDSSQFQGRKNAPLVIECFDFVEALRSQLAPPPADVPEPEVRKDVELESASEQA